MRWCKKWTSVQQTCFFKIMMTSVNPAIIIWASLIFVMICGVRSQERIMKVNRPKFHQTNGITWHLLYSNANRLLPNALWRRAGLYCKLPHGYVDLDTYYYEDGFEPFEDRKISPDDFTRRALLSPANLADDNHPAYGNSVLSSVLEHFHEESPELNDVLDLESSTSDLVPNTYNVGEGVQNLAASLLNYYTTRESYSSKEENNAKTNSEESTDTKLERVGPLRYVFLLGILPLVFGSLFAMGYAPIQILLVGAYIVSSYFAVVEKRFGRVEQDEIQQVIDRVAEQFLSATNGNLTEFPDVRSQFLRSVALHESPEDHVLPLTGAKWLNVTGLLDERSSTFINLFEDILKKYTGTNEVHLETQNVN